MNSREDLLATDEPFPDHLAPEVADQLIRLARSAKSDDVNLLIKVGMIRGLKHPRFAVQAIEAELGQRFARQSVDLAQQNVRLSRTLLWVTGLAALAAIANVVAVLLG